MAALDLRTPGVFIEEVSTLPASVAAVGTAIPAFIGYTKNQVDEPIRIKSMVDFVEKFGGPDTNVEVVIQNASSNPNDPAFSSLTVLNTNFLLFYSLQMHFANGGGPCYVISTGDYLGGVVVGDFTAALGKLAKEDEPTLIVIPDAVGLSAASFHNTMKAALAQCGNLQDRFTITDLHGDGNLTNDPSAFRTGVGTLNLKYGAAYYPRLQTTLKYPDSAIMIEHLAGPGGGTDLNTLTLAEAIEAAEAETGTTPISDDLNLVLSAIRKEVENTIITLPPSGAIAGIYATVDRTRGVWKAPANISLNSVISPTVKISEDEQAPLNVDSTGKSINVIKLFTGKGILVWGSRTLAGNDNEWRYVPVRRLFIMAEESIKKATQFVVFEANDANTWLRARTMIENFLNILWRQGALAGAKPEDAFFVNVGLGETMSPQDILEGRLIIEVGMAAVRPAEFIILRFTHKLQE